MSLINRKETKLQALPTLVSRSIDHPIAHNQRIHVSPQKTIQRLSRLANHQLIFVKRRTKHRRHTCLCAKRLDQLIVSSVSALFDGLQTPRAIVRFTDQNCDAGFISGKHLKSPIGRAAINHDQLDLAVCLSKHRLGRRFDGVAVVRDDGDNRYLQVKRFKLGLRGSPTQVLAGARSRIRAIRLMQLNSCIGIDVKQTSTRDR